MSASMPRIETGLRHVVDGHDGFFVDLWGTLHDGHDPLPGAAECLQALRRFGPVCLLSNSHRRREVEVQRLETMGFSTGDYDGLVTAGEVCRERLKGDLPPGCGNRFFFVGLEENASLFDDLDVVRADAIDEADFVLIGDPENDKQNVEAYEPLLRAALERALVVVCPNPDRWSFWGTQRRVKPGAIADHYEAMGGQALWYGKPCANTFEAGMDALTTRPTKVMVIGDGISNDMAGARDAGMDACFVAGGREAPGLGIAAGEAPDPTALKRLFAEEDVNPLATVALFVF